MKVAIVLGTRPEIIKMSPVIRACRARGLDHFVLHTGQHYSYSMDEIFFRDLELPGAEHNLEVGSGTHGAQTAKILVGSEKVFMKERPDVILVQGDTNTVMAAALAASKMGIKVGHVEAGLRSYDRKMPEEINRVIADHVSDYLFAPTEESKNNLAKEGLVNGVHVTGNTIVDAVMQNRELAQRKASAMARLGLRPKDFVLVTSHRQENVDSKDKLSSILAALDRVEEELGMPVVFPAHPRTVARMKEFGLTLKKARVVEPLGFLDFLQAESNAKLIITDSGGVQEEACILGVPCVTMRENTERPETVKVGANVLAGTDVAKIVELARQMARKKADWPNPFGDGKAAPRMLDILSEG